MKKKCFQMCVDEEITCPVKDCRFWINYKQDLNCTVVCANQNGPLSLREVADRMGVSFVRIKQIQDVTIDKFVKRLSREGVKETDVMSVLGSIKSGEEDHSLA